MDKRRRTLILDTDPDTLIMLQQVLEDADIDATVTWDAMEACQLIETALFDLYSHWRSPSRTKCGSDSR